MFAPRHAHVRIPFTNLTSHEPRPSEACACCTVKRGYCTRTFCFRSSTYLYISVPGNVTFLLAVGHVRHVRNHRILSRLAHTYMLSSAVERQLAEERREQRRTARLRCRARDLKDCAEHALELLRQAASTSDLAPGDSAAVEIRPLSPLELGLMYAWMELDESDFCNSTDTADSQRVTSWW